jgi:hypothetical protein
MSPGKTRAGGGTRITRQGSGKIRKPASAPRRSPATSGLRPGELMNANAFPRNAIAKSVLPRRESNLASSNSRENIKRAGRFLKARGYTAGAVDMKNDSINAAVHPSLSPRRVNINSTGKWAQNPRKTAIEERRAGHSASSHPMATIHHEIGHLKESARRGWSSKKAKPPQNAWTNNKDLFTANRVSRYASTSPREFVAETYAGLRTGRRYDPSIMSLYRATASLSPKPSARRRSRLKRR